MVKCIKIPVTNEALFKIYSIFVWTKYGQNMEYLYKIKLL